ncbi:MAG: KEOPS complex subunit Cgi121 [Promethearchaeota archaeon]
MAELGIDSMIVKEFKIEDLKLHYFIGINQIEIDIRKILEVNNITDQKELPDLIFSKIETLQNNFSNVIIQITNNKYILNQDHIFTAGYYLQKAFLQNLNISNKRNIEFILYLSANRQISKGFEAFGITDIDLKKHNLITCIISPINNIGEINRKILLSLNAYEIDITINDQSIEKFNRIKEFYEISENQIASVLKSYGIYKINEEHLYNNLNAKFLAVHDLLCEKMALLNIERAKIS